MEAISEKTPSLHVNDERSEFSFNGNGLQGARADRENSLRNKEEEKSE